MRTTPASSTPARLVEEAMREGLVPEEKDIPSGYAGVTEVKGKYQARFYRSTTRRGRSSVLREVPACKISCCGTHVGGPTGSFHAPSALRDRQRAYRTNLSYAYRVHAIGPTSLVYTRDHPKPIHSQ